MRFCDQARGTPIALLACSLALSVSGAPAAEIPPGFTETVLVTDVNGASDLDWAPDGDLWISTRYREVWIYRQGTLIRAAELAGSSVGERGIHGMALDPDYSQNGHVWIFYTADDPVRNKLSRFTNVGDTLVEVTPLDLEVDADGFTDFARSYVNGTQVTVTAPLMSNGRRFLRWSVDGVLQPVGLRSVEVTVGGAENLKVFYQRRARATPDRPTESQGDME